MEDNVGKVVRYAKKLCFDGCKLCNGCRELVKDWDVFPQECKVREEIMYNIEERLFPFMKMEKAQGLEEYREHIISELNRFEALKRKNNVTIFELDKRREKVYWCSVNYVFWCDRKSIEVLNEELKNIEPAKNQKTIPSELDTEQARKYFARAIEEGYMNEQYQWIVKNRADAKLGYFCWRTFEKKIPGTVKALKSFFGKKSISASISQAEWNKEHAKRKDCIQWMKEMDEKIFFD